MGINISNTIPKFQYVKSSRLLKRLCGENDSIIDREWLKRRITELNYEHNQSRVELLSRSCPFWGDRGTCGDHCSHFDNGTVINPEITMYNGDESCTTGTVLRAKCKLWTNR